MPAKISREATEVGIGAVALVAFALFVVFAFTVNEKAVSGYRLYAKYRHIDGLALHADVRLAGIRVGEVSSQRLAPPDQAVVILTVRNGVEIPRDSAAIIASEGLLGAKFVKIDPGGDSEMLKPGESFDYVQDSVDFEHLLKRVVEEAEAKRNKAKPAQPGKGS
ncbi:MAG: MlaD family protein [Alphaproteobacteria bacterium]